MPDIKDVPEEFQRRFALVAAQFKLKYDIPHDDVIEFMMDIIQIYDDYMNGDKLKVN